MTTREYYEKHRGDFRDVINAQHILVETEEEAKDLLARIEAGADFGELAEACSLCPSGRESKGVLGFVPHGAYVPPFEAAVNAMENIGDICGPVQSQFGYHIIKLVGKKEELPMEECEEMIQMLIEHNPEA